MFKKGQSSWNKGTKGVMKSNKTSFGKGKNHFNYGKHLSEETKEKIRMAHLGMKPSEETKKKLGLLHKGKHYSPNTEFKKGCQALETSLRRGNEHPCWKGGRMITLMGYIHIHKHTHPFCNSKGYICEHRLVIEKQIGRFLLPVEKGHHLGEKTDNRPCMLMAFVNDSAHRRFHCNPDSVKPSEIIFDGRLLK